jgi:hypothetical protein
MVESGEVFNLMDPIKSLHILYKRAVQTFDTIDPKVQRYLILDLSNGHDTRK